MINENQAATKRCRNCGYEVALTTKFCSNCGFPENSSEHNQNVYRRKMKAKKDQLAKLEKKFTYSSYILFIIAAFTMFSVFLLPPGSEEEQRLAIIISAVVAAIFVGIGIWSFYNRFAGVLTGLILYVTLLILNAVVDPATIIQGIVIKAIILTTMVGALSGYKKAQVLKKEVNFTKA